MINANKFILELKKLNIDFFTGVPDSLMSSFSKSLHFDFNDDNHIISTNEGSAIAAGMGYHLATNRVPLIYMQNSGLGNIVNPYNSLLHKNIYNIPFLLLIGWRGEPGTNDEPQHTFQGEITLDLLDLLGINFMVIDEGSEIKNILETIEKSVSEKEQLAIVVKRNTFESDSRSFDKSSSSTKRSVALENIIEKFDNSSLFISTTGKLSRELYEIRVNSGRDNDDFYVVGGMGHASAIATGILHEIEDKKIVCLDGDGSILMHMGHLSLVAKEHYKNFIHIVFNNSAHESVGGQPNDYAILDRNKLFEALGYKENIFIKNISEIENYDFKNLVGPVYIEIEVENSSSKNLMRPDKPPVVNKESFVRKIHE